MRKILFTTAFILSSLAAANASDNTDKATTNYSSTQWQYYAASDYDGGSGTEDDPYLIATPEQFMKLAVEIENLAADDDNWGEEYSYGKYWKQTADLVFNDDVTGCVSFSSGDASTIDDDNLRNYTGIGYYLDEYDYQVFAGTYDGDGHTITGLYMSTSSNATGLFNVVWYGTIKNLVVKDAYLTGNANVGLIAGKLEEGASIINCQTSGIIYCGGSYHAGIAGYVNAGSVANCVSDAWLWAKNNDAGIIGRGSYTTTVDNCFFYGWIGAVYSNIAKFQYWGAIAAEFGLAEDTYDIEDPDSPGDTLTLCDNPSTATNCYWTDTCTVRHVDSGTIEAVHPDNSTYGVVENCYSVSVDSLSATVDALNTVAATIDGACGWELDENNRVTLTFDEPSASTGITSASVLSETEGKTVTGYFTLDGIQMSEPADGVNIVKYSDGTAIKIIK